MKKRLPLIIVLVLSLVFIIAGCTSTPAKPSDNQGKDDLANVNFSSYANYVPTFGELQNRKFNEGELVVGYEKGKKDALNTLLGKLKGATIEKEIPELNAVLIKLNISVMDVMKAFEILNGEKIDGIRYVEPNYVDRELPVIKSKKSANQIYKSTSNNTLQEETSDDLMQYQYALDLLGAQSAWEEASGTDIIIGLLDTGTDGTHPDLQGQLVEGYDPYLGDPIDPDVDSDTDGHGTHTAGIIAANKDNGGTVGLAPNAKIMPIRIFNPNYVGDYAVADGIVWAVDNGADVLSNSWGGGGYSNILKDAFDYALVHNVVVVASAGNDTTDQYWHYPSGYTGVIAVAASNARDKITDFSSRGEYVSVAAPGENVLSSIPVRLAEDEGVEGTPYAYWAGTSMACPYVSASAALLKQKYPEADVYQIKKMIEDGAMDIEAEGYDTASGYGRISAESSLQISPDDYKGGALAVVAASKKGEYALGAVNVTIENKSNGKRYYGKTNYYGWTSFYWIEPGDYKVIIGGPEYLSLDAYNFRMQEELAYATEVTVTGDFGVMVDGTPNGTITELIQYFETTNFKTELRTSLEFPGTLTINLEDYEGTVLATSTLVSGEELNMDLLEHTGNDIYHFITYKYDGELPTATPTAKEDFESESLNSFFNWQLGGNEQPFVTTENSNKVLQFGDIEDSQESWIQTTLNLTDAHVLSFKAKVSSEGKYDYLNVYVDGTLVRSLSGELDWNTYSIMLNPGTHTVKFAYEKDFLFSDGEDTAWLDDIVLSKPFGIVGTVTINDETIPVSVLIPQAGIGYIDEFNGYGIPWAIF